MASVPQDLRLGLRVLAKQPGFTALAVVILALGIGVNTAAFGITNAFLLRPRPGVGDQLVGIYSRDRTQPDSYRPFSYPEFVDLRDHHELFASLVGTNFALVGLTDGDTTRRVFVGFVAGNMFEAFGVPLARGRTFTTAEERPGADVPVAIISYSLWQRLGGREDVLDRTVQVNQRAFNVVGIAPEGFGGPMVLFTPEMWLPTGVYDTLKSEVATQRQTLADRRDRHLVLIARLQPSLTMASAAPVLSGVARQMERAHPAESRNRDLMVAPLSRLSVKSSPSTDAPLMTVPAALSIMAGLVLLIASLNLANMVLARGGARRKECAIRLAIGGSRGRVVRQLLVENALLSLAGGAVGLLLGWWALALLAASLRPAMPISITFDARPDLRVFLATLAFCLMSTLAFGLGPAWKLARTDALPELKEYAGELPGGRRSRFGLAGRDLLVMGQLAASLVLLTAAGLFVRGAAVAARTDPGFSFDRGLVVNVDTSFAGEDEARAREIYRRALAVIRRQPGVQAASLATLMPFSGFDTTRGVQRPGAPAELTDPGTGRRLIQASCASITADYFRSLGLSVRRGREFSLDEEFATGGPPIAIVDDALARDVFGDGDPVGQQVQIASASPTAAPVVYDVVGLAPPIRQDLFDATPTPHVYVPIGRDFGSNVYFHVKTSAGAAETEAAMLPAIRRALLSVDARLPILALETQATSRDRNADLVLLHAGAGVFSVFGGVALFMAALGVYGVKAYLVSRRTREIGIRVALGAPRGSVVWMIVREGLTLSAVGLAIGAGLSIAAGMGLQELLYQGGGRNGLVILIAGVTLAAAALAASWLPARRASGIAPIKALRSE